jgi:putative tricarboxylic transport membrane protein
MDRRVDLLIAVMVAALGVFMIISAQFIAESPVPDPIGPKGIPVGLGAFFVIGGVALATRRVVRWKQETTFVTPEGIEDDRGVAPGSARRALGIWVVALLYVIALPILGHPIATPIALAVMLRMLEFDRPPVLRIPALIFYPVAFTAVSYTVFAVILGIRLPQGFIRDIIRMLSGSG